VKPPHWSLALSEAPRALIDCVGLPLAKRLLLKSMPQGKGHGVMVIPGFMGEDNFNKPLVNFLNELGYRARGWGQGRNLGPGSFSEEQMEEDLGELALAGDGKVTLIGHSLGGIYAREVAREQPDGISQVITLGSPFAEGRDSGSNASRLFKLLNPDSDADSRQADLGTPPPVTTTAIFTKGDGVVNWRTSLQEGVNHQVHNIEVLGSHIGLTINPMVWYWISRKLSQA
jgi:pimeloyl-ACP methyl ester carboxylesterase